MTMSVKQTLFISTWFSVALTRIQPTSPVTAGEVLPFATNGEHGTTSRNGLCHTATVMTWPLTVLTMTRGIPLIIADGSRQVRIVVTVLRHILLLRSGNGNLWWSGVENSTFHTTLWKREWLTIMRMVSIFFVRPEERRWFEWESEWLETMMLLPTTEPALNDTNGIYFSKYPFSRCLRRHHWAASKGEKSGWQSYGERFEAGTEHHLWGYAEPL